MFHITLLVGIFHLQQIFEVDGNKIPQKRTFTNPCHISSLRVIDWCTTHSKYQYSLLVICTWFDMVIFFISTLIYDKIYDIIYNNININHQYVFYSSAIIYSKLVILIHGNSKLMIIPTSFCMVIYDGIWYIYIYMYIYIYIDGNTNIINNQ